MTPFASPDAGNENLAHLGELIELSHAGEANHTSAVHGEFEQGK